MQIFDYWMTALKWISWSKLLRQRRGGLTGKQCSRRGGGVIEPLEVRRLLSTLTVNASGGANFSDLSDAIVAAHNGDTILVSPGTYTAIGTVVDSQPIYYINKALTIQSTNGAGNTILSITGGQNVGIWITASI